ncbi:cellulase family glycosylhydrolase [Daejeonella lutea]|uniref:Carbohydrate binding module (Family 6) n=1 Tax=Daejeonella lutea TaxID=572036 RepID=A0A1T5ADD9_9SPHI|nr:cellulase family glycosylhydrolase [Daejeonella lutea]SKB32829.1 Carbohydrate binding module (family 6) [Daejeonella lutea]
MIRYINKYLQFLRIVSFLFIIIFFSSSSQAQLLKTDGKRIVNDKGNNILLRGIGLGGWMLQEGYMLKINREGQQYRIRERIAELMGKEQTDQFYDLWLSNHTRKADIDSMKAWGFNSVRLPMHFNLYTLPVDQEPVPGKDTWLAKGFALTDSLLSWCKQNEMYLILDLHAAPGGQGNDLNISDRDPAKPSLWESEDNQRKTIALWHRIAERYADEPWIGGYDLINEPNWGFEDLKNDKNGTKEQKNEPLQKLLKDITAAIRQVDKKHIVIIEGNGWGNNYRGITPDWDDNMVLSFHKYWAYNDAASASNMLKMRDQYNMPVWLGETGENSNVWFTEAIRLFENNNIGWNWWPLKKIGSNNPVEIKSNLNYDRFVNYINGRNGAGKPKESDVYSGLMEMATYARIENAIIHRDVIDAMIRQPFSTEVRPYRNHIISKNTLVEAVDYDMGRNGIAYFDTDTADYHVSTGKNTPGNRGRIYRNDGVDIMKDSTSYNRYFVSNIEDGEWLQYTVDVVKKGIYKLKFEVASGNEEGKISVKSGSTLLVNSFPVPNTGNPKKFMEITIDNVALSSGKQTLRIYAERGGFNLRSWRLLR